MIRSISFPRRGHSRSGRTRHRPAVALGAVALAVGLVALAGGPATVGAADQPTIKVDPATADVSPGQEFVVNLIQSTTIETTGAQVNVLFDVKLVHLKDFALGPSYTAAQAIFAFGNADLGTNAAKELAINQANRSGTLENPAGFLLPGSGTLPAGDTVFLTLTFVGQGGDGGSMNLGLAKGSMIGAAGEPLTPHLVNGKVNVAAGVAPSGAPGSSAEPSAGASEGPSEAPIVPVSPTTPVKVSIAPTSLELKAGNTARIFIVANADGSLTSLAADVTFDKDKLEITSLEAGPKWESAVVITVASGGNGVAAAISEANSSGVLKQAGAFLPPGGTDLPSGEGVVVSIIVTAKVDGTSSLSIGNAAALGVAGETVPVEIDTTSLTKPPEKAVQLDPTLVIPLVALLAIVLGGLVVWRSGRIPVRVRRRWPFYVSMVLGLVPVVLFATVVLIVIANALPVVNDPGLGALLGGQFLDVKGNLIAGFSILPAIWGTLLVTAIAAAVALPIALVLGIIAVDFPLGPIGRLVRPVVGMLSGIPEIVYAVSVPVFVGALMIPKFAANSIVDTFQPAAIGADPATWPPADVPFNAGAFPWSAGEANSTLLGGLIVGLFLIPFVTPMFVDALANVPRAVREGSLALGANRTYTLRRVVLPRALPAIAGASTLAVLKAMGDAVIVIFAVGFAAIFPSPPVDVLERAAPVGAWGANLLGSFDTLSPFCSPQSCAVGYSSALVLLLAAGIVVSVLTYLQARGRRRVVV